MKLSDKLKSGDLYLSPISPSPEALRQITSELNTIRRRWPHLEQLQDIQDPERLCRDILARIKTQNWKNVSWGKICMTVRALFSGSLYQQEKFLPLKKFLIEILSYDDTTRPFYKDIFARTYLETFDPASPKTAELAKILTQYITQCSPSLSQIFEQYDLLDRPRAAQNLSKIFTLDNPIQAFQDVSFNAPRNYKIVERAYLVYLQTLSPLLKRGHIPTLEKLFLWLRMSEDNNTILDKSAEETVKAILSPWLEKTPQEAVKDIIVENLVGLFNDPRLSRSGIWTNLPERQIDLICRWLTKSSLLTFLDIVDKVVKGTQDAHMWPERRKFWERLFKEGRIDEAWVALSERGQAEQRRQNQHKQINLKSAKTTGDRDKCLLILRCGNLIVVEGSHNYKVRLFDKNKMRSPKLYRHSYDLDQIRALDNEARFSTSHDRRWSQKIEMEIIRGA